MKKLFCPRCSKKGLRSITFVLRYFSSEQTWKLPRDNPHYCENCREQAKEKECLTKDQIDSGVKQ